VKKEGTVFCPSEKEEQRKVGLIRKTTWRGKKSFFRGGRESNEEEPASQEKENRKNPVGFLRERSINSTIPYLTNHVQAPIDRGLASQYLVKGTMKEFAILPLEEGSRERRVEYDTDHVHRVLRREKGKYTDSISDSHREGIPKEKTQEKERGALKRKVKRKKTVSIVTRGFRRPFLERQRKL